MLTVLIADDEHHICNYIASLLQTQDWDVDVHTAYSGTEAMEAIQNTVFNLAILDIDMPGFSGLEVAKEVAALYPRTRILFLTAYDNFDYIYSAVSLRCYGYLLKIESEQTILQKIGQAVADIQAEQQRMAQVDNAKQNDLLGSFIKQQAVLGQIINGQDAAALREQMDSLSPAIAPQAELPFYLMYLRHARPSGNSGKPGFADHFLAQRIQLMHSLLSGKMLCYTYRDDEFSHFFAFQPEDPESQSTELVYLKRVADEYISSIGALTEAAQETVVLCTEPLPLEKVSQTAQKLRLCSKKLPLERNSYVTFVDGAGMDTLLNQPESRSRNPKNAQILRSIQSYIEKNYASKLTLSSVATLVSYNESYISRLFKKETGKGVIEFINEVRMEKAKELLVTTSDNIQDIALAVGFDTPQYFSMLFKRQEGISPTEYRVLQRPSGDA